MASFHKVNVKVARMKGKYQAWPGKPPNYKKRKKGGGQDAMLKVRS